MPRLKLRRRGGSYRYARGDSNLRLSRAVGARFRVGRVRRRGLISGHHKYTYRRFVNLGSFGNDLSGEHFGSSQFKLSDLPNYTEFVALYDQYRLLKVTYRIIPLVTESNFTGSVAPALGRLYSVIDPDDASVPGTVNELREYQTCKVTRGNKIHTRVIRPTLLDAIYDGVTTAYGVNRTGRWIDCDYPTVPHYGIKFAYESTSAVANSFQASIECTYIVQFQTVK